MLYKYLINKNNNIYLQISTLSKGQIMEEPEIILQNNVRRSYTAKVSSNKVTVYASNLEVTLLN